MFFARYAALQHQLAILRLNVGGIPVTHPVEEAACWPTLQLQLDPDFAERTYLLVAPDERSHQRPVPNGVAYDPLVHAAWVLARRGHDSAFLSSQLSIPHQAACHIVMSARQRPAAAPNLHAADVRTPALTRWLGKAGRALRRRGAARTLRRGGRAGRRPGQVPRMPSRPRHLLQSQPESAKSRGRWRGRPVPRPLTPGPLHSGRAVSTDSVRVPLRLLPQFRRVVPAVADMTADLALQGGLQHPIASAAATAGLPRLVAVCPCRCGRPASRSTARPTRPPRPTGRPAPPRSRAR